MMLIAVLLLVMGPFAPVLSEEPVMGCNAFSTWRVTASGTVFCDARTREVPQRVTVTLMDADDNPDDVAEYDKYLPDFVPSMNVPAGRFAVGGSLTDWFGGNVPEPYLLVKGVCSVENYNGAVELKHFEEKVGLPCDFACNQDRIDVRGLEILLDGVSDREIC